jgi:hypothetical protein
MSANDSSFFAAAPDFFGRSYSIPDRSEPQADYNFESAFTSMELNM